MRRRLPHNGFCDVLNDACVISPSRTRSAWRFSLQKLSSGVAHVTQRPA